MSDLLPAGYSLRWLGHATLQLTGPRPGQRFLFDPFIEHNPRFPEDQKAAVGRPGTFDALVVTHAHFDHFEAVVPLLEGDPALKVICPFEIGAWLEQKKGIAEERLLSLNPGGTAELNHVRFTMTSAIHSSSIPEDRFPRSLGCPSGYVLRFADGFTIYNTGDTAVTMDMQIVRDLYRPDLVILPIGDFYTMGAEQAAYALKLLQPRLALGVHWHTWGNFPPASADDLEREMSRYDLPTQLIKLQPGESLS